MTQAMRMPVHVDPEMVAVTPGEPVPISVSVFNTSKIIDAFEITLVGADQKWVTSDPAEVRLFPDTADVVDVSITIPAEFPAGLHDLTVRVTSQTTGETVASSVVVLDVQEKHGVTVQLDPEQVVAGRTARFGLVASNDGNVAIDLKLSADDKTNELNYHIDPRHLILQPGGTGLSQVVVRGSRPLTGSPRVRPFVLTAESKDVRTELQASFVSQPWIPHWAITFLSVALLMGLWAFVVGLAIDAIIEDGNGDLTEAFAEGMESVVDAIDPDAITGSSSTQTANASAALAAAGALQGADGTFVGRVVATVDGAPVPGATVLAIPLGQAGTKKGLIDPSTDPVEAAVAEDGTFVFEEMPDGSYILFAAASGFLTPPLPAPTEAYECSPSGPTDPPCLSVPATGALGEIVLSLTGKPGLISGIVTNDGDPQEEVLIEVNRLVDPDAVQSSDSGESPEAKSFTTDESGRFALEPLATPASYELVVAAPGSPVQRLVVPLAAGQRLVELELAVLPPGIGKVFGTVTDRATRAPLGGVMIELTSAEGTSTLTAAAYTVSTATNGIGDFQLLNLREGEHVVTFKLDGYDDVVIPLSIPIEPERPLILAMTPSSGPDGAPIGTVGGIVTDALTGQGIGGAEVTLSGSNGTFVTSTLSSPAGSLGVGSYSVSGIPLGSYTASYSATYYRPAALPVNVTVDDARPEVSAQLEIIPTPVTGTISVVTGTTDKPSIEPLPGLDILYDPTPANPDDETLTLGTTDAVGGFAIEVPATPGIHSLTLDGEFLVPAIELAIEPGTSIDAEETTLIRLFTVTGSLVDQFRRALVDALDTFNPPLSGDVTVTITQFMPADNLFSIDTTDPDYQFSFPIDEELSLPGLPGPAKYRFRVTLPATSSQLTRTVTTDEIDVPTNTKTGDIEFKFASGVLWGTLTAQGAPLANTVVDLSEVPASGNMSVVESAKTDLSGQVVFGPLATPATDFRVIVPTTAVTCTPDIDVTSSFYFSLTCD